MDKQKHILILSSWFPTREHPFLGNFVIQQAELVANAFNVTFLTLVEKSDSKRYTVTQKTENNITYFEVSYKPSSHKLLNLLAKKRAFSNALTKIQQVDLIHGHISYPNGWMFAKAKRYFKCPLVLTEHGSYFMQNQNWSPRMYSVISKTLRYSDKIIAVSSILKKDMLKRFPNLKIKVIGNPVDTELFNIKEKTHSKFTFLHISTLAKIKHVEEIVLAFSELCKSEIDVELHIVSDEDSGHLQALTADLGLSDSISFFGPSEISEMPHYYQNANCFILNSEYETFSIVLAEAMSCGLPIISTKTGLVNDLNAGKGIFTSNFRDVKEISENMKKMIHRINDFDSSQIRYFVISNYNNLLILKKISQIYEKA